jgi:hypothetical protein
MRLYHSHCNIAARMPLVGVVHVRVAPVSRGLQGRMRRVEATYKPQKTLIPRQPSCSRYATSDWCSLPAASSFPRHWRRCSDVQSGKYVRRRLDADWCRDQYHKQKPLQVAFSAVHRISCCNPPPSQVSVSRCVPCQDSFQNLSQNRVPESVSRSGTERPFLGQNFEFRT